MLCQVSGLGYGSHTEEDSKVARSVDMQIGTWDACLDSPQEHRLCALDRDTAAPCVGDLGGSVVCHSEPQDKLYGIISEITDSALEQQPDRCKFPVHDAGFQFVGFYAPWIKETAGDLPSAEEVEAIIEQHEQDFLFSGKGRNKRNSENGDESSSQVPSTGSTDSDNGGGAESDGAESLVAAPRRWAALLSMLAAGDAGVLA